MLAARYAGAPSTADADTDPAVAGGVPCAASAARRGWTRGVLWLALPACATALLLAATNTITQDLAPVPLLWILPLGLYLLTFIIAFDRPGWYVRPLWGLLLVGATGWAFWLLFDADDVDTAAVLVASVAAVLFVGCMVLHGELARLRPPPRRLTAYYLTIAAGGVLGGLLVAVGAPVLLRSYAELPAALWACCFLAFAAPLLAERRVPRSIPALLGIAGLVCLAPLAWRLAHRTLDDAKLVDRSRDYYGVLSVWERTESDGSEGVILHHGSITHGHQYRAEAARDIPTTYYHPGTAVGQILGEDSPLPTPRRVGVVGLGTGTIAAYAQAGDAYRFYEISPNVLRLAETHFTYLADARARGASLTVALGDARLSLEREASDQLLDALVLDAFSGDAIPVHLLTAEAFDLYKRHLAPSGVLCVHVSNKYLNLEVVVAAAAKRLGWQAVLVSTDDGAGMDYSADWVLLGPDRYRIEQLRRLGGEPLPDAPPGFPLWTDERTNVLRILR